MHDDIMQQALQAVWKTMLRITESSHQDEQNGNSPLHSFSKVWSHIDTEFGGVREAVPADLQLQMSADGSITIIQSGSHYILIPANQAAEFRAAVNALIPAADVGTDADRNALPKTSLQMSQDQNMKVAAFLKQRQR